MWFYAATGTGVFVNVGRSVFFRSRSAESLPSHAPMHMDMHMSMHMFMHMHMHMLKRESEFTGLLVCPSSHAPMLKSVNSEPSHRALARID